MKDYDERGTFQNDGWAKQLVKFDGMVFTGKNGKKTVTPTDIDGVIQLEKENCTILFELKYKGGAGSMSEGQRLALIRMCDAMAKGGMHSVVFVAEHNAEAPDPVFAKDAIIKLYHLPDKDKGIPIKGGTLFDGINDYIAHIKRRNET